MLLMYDINLFLATEMSLQSKSSKDLSIFSLICDRDKEGLSALLDGEANLQVKDSCGRTPLTLAALLGQDDVITLLLNNGMDVNCKNSSGYTALHVAAAWGQLAAVKSLVSGGADHSVKNQHNETPRDIACRYGKEECVVFLDQSEARTILSSAITQAKATLTDTEKISGKWNKEDKMKVNSLCNEKLDWIEKNFEGSTLEDIEKQYKDFQERIEPYYSKIT